MSLLQVDIRVKCDHFMNVLLHHVKLLKYSASLRYCLLGSCISPACHMHVCTHVSELLFNDRNVAKSSFQQFTCPRQLLWINSELEEIRMPKS